MRPSASEIKLHDGTRWSRLVRNRLLSPRALRRCLPLLAVVGMAAPWLVIYQGSGTEQRSEHADVPSARVAGQADGRWVALHESFVERARAGDIKLLFIGDSLTMQWLQQPAWRDEWAPRGAVNFGIGGDRIQHAHWRLLHGEIGISPPPQACVLQLGTNNLESDSVEEILSAAGRQKSPLRTLAVYRPAGAGPPAARGAPAGSSLRSPAWPDCCEPV